MGQIICVRMTIRGGKVIILDIYLSNLGISLSLFDSVFDVILFRLPRTSARAARVSYCSFCILLFVGESRGPILSHPHRELHQEREGTAAILSYPRYITSKILRYIIMYI